MSCCSLVEGIPLNTVGTNALTDVTTVVEVVVVGCVVLVVVGGCVVVVGGGGDGGVVVVVAIVVVDFVVDEAVVDNVVVGTLVEGFSELNWFLDFDLIKDLNDLRGILKGLRVNFAILRALLVSIRFSLIPCVVVVVVNDCGVSSAGSDSSWRATSSLGVSSAIFLKILFLLRKRFLGNKDFLENLFSFLSMFTD